MALIDRQDQLGSAQQAVLRQTRKRSTAFWLVLALLLVAINALVWLGMKPLQPIVDRSLTPMDSLNSDGIDASPRQKRPSAPIVAVEPTLASNTDSTGVSTNNDAVLEGQCWIWGVFNPEQLKQAEPLLRQSKLPTGFETLTSKQTLPFLIQIGPFTPDANLQSKIAILKNAQFQNFKVMPSKHIVVAQLSTAEGAKALQTRLEALKLGRVEIVQKNQTTTLTRFKFLSLSEDQRAGLIGLSKKIGTVLPCGAN